MYPFEQDMETELEAPWATVEEDAEAEVDGPAVLTGVSLAACTEAEHPWRQNDVEPLSPSFPPHATDTQDDTNGTTITARNDTGPLPSVFSLRQSYNLSSALAPNIVSLLSPDRNGEEATRAAGEESEQKPVAIAPSSYPSTWSQRRTVNTAWVDLLDASWQTMNYINDGTELTRSTYNAAWDTVGAVWRALTSKTARRTLLTTVLVSLASAFLFGLACLGYLAFYHEYLPDQVTTIPLHLQYGYVGFRLSC